MDATNDNGAGLQCADVLSDGIAPIWTALRNGVSYNYLGICAFRYDYLYIDPPSWPPTAAREAQVDEVLCEHGIYPNPHCFGVPPVTGVPTSGDDVNRGVQLAVLGNPIRGRGMVLRLTGAASGEAPTSVSVFDIAGRRVADLAPALGNDGSILFTWNHESGKAAAGRGVYFVSVRVGGSVIMRRVVLL